MSWAAGCWEGMSGGGGTVLVGEYLLEVDDNMPDILLDDTSLDLTVDDSGFEMAVDDTDYYIEVCDE